MYARYYVYSVDALNGIYRFHSLAFSMIKLPTSVWSEKKRNSRKISISASLTLLKPLTVWITTDYVDHNQLCRSQQTVGNSLRDGNTRPPSIQFSSVQLFSRIWLFVTPWIAAHQASLSITISRSLLKLMSIESGMPSSHLILCRPLLLLPPILPSIRVFSNESILRMRWPKYWSFSFSISPSSEHPGLISFRIKLVGSPCSPRDSQESILGGTLPAP